MRIAKNKQRPHKKIILTLLFLAAIALVLFGLWYAYVRPTEPTKPTGPSPEQIQQEKTQAANDKKTFIEDTKDVETPGTPQETPSDTSGIKLSATNQNGVIVIKTELTGGYSSGTCVLTATNAGRSLTKEAPIIYQPSFSTCAGFELSNADLGNGTWNLTLTVTPDGGQPLSKSIEVSV